MKSSISSATADVARYAPATILAASSWILSSLAHILAVCPFSQWGVYQTEQPYVICGMTIAKYTRRRVVKAAPQVDPARDLRA